MSIFSEYSTNNSNNGSYTARDIEVLEGLEPVRLRPGMYIGGTDETALHHLIVEVLDNAMDEAVAGYASFISIHMHIDGSITIADNGRGIPVDRHPKYPDKSALEIILTKLHSGGKFNNQVYTHSGGLHGVGISVVNALSEYLEISVIRNNIIYNQKYSKGEAISELSSEKGFSKTNPNYSSALQKHLDTAKAHGKTSSKVSGTLITFLPDVQIFGDKVKFNPSTVYQLAETKAYLFKDITILWRCDEALIQNDADAESEQYAIPIEKTIHFPNGLSDLTDKLAKSDNIIQDFKGSVITPEKARIEWSIKWITSQISSVPMLYSYCNTIRTIGGGSHEVGMRNALLKGIKKYGEIIHNKKYDILTSEDIASNIVGAISLFINNPSFQGQTKDRLLNPEVTKIVENSIRNQLEHWLINNPDIANVLLEELINSAERRIAFKKSKAELFQKKLSSSKLSVRLPGKLTDCNSNNSSINEIFLVEGESAGGTAKQARDRENQAILPLKGKILNVANSSIERIKLNQEIIDLTLALGYKVNGKYNEEHLRYGKVIIMTDADVDGDHVASLLLTYFIISAPELIINKHLYLAQPPLYRITCNNKTYYAKNEQERDKIMNQFNKRYKNIEVGRFKGLGEMNASQLKETTMSPISRSLLQVVIHDLNTSTIMANSLMGKKPETRLQFIKENCTFMQHN